MSFFQGASNVTINGGQSNNANYTVYDHSRHEANYDSNNVYNNEITDSYNDNSKRFSRNTGSHFTHDDEEDKDMDWTSSATSDLRGGRQDNDKRNMPGNSDEDHESNDSDSSSHSIEATSTRMADPSAGNSMPSSTSRKFHPQTATHPSDSRRPIRPQVNHSMGGTNPSNFGSHNNAPQPSYTYPFVAPAHMREPPMANFQSSSGGSGPSNFRSHNNAPHHSYSYPFVAPTHMREPPMANFQSSSGGSGPSNFRSHNNAPHHSYSYPSVAPTSMKEPPMANFQPSSAHWHQDDKNDPLKPPPTSTSGFNSPPSSSSGPEFWSGPVRQDSSFHHTNASSFNMTGNTITGSFNDNSSVDSTGKWKKRTKKQATSERR